MMQMIEVKFGHKTVGLPYTIRIRGVTEEMFDEWPDEDVKAELIDGVMVVHSPATIENDDIAGFIRTLMRIYASRKRAGIVLGPDAVIHLATCRKFGPDIFYLHKGRMPKPRPKEFEGAPDLTIEVLSPSNRLDDLEDKRPAYRAAGVGEIWFVDLEAREVIVDRKRRRKYVEETVTRGILASDVLQGFWLDVSWLWADPLPDCLECLDKMLGKGKS
jgi:Uma2 family endonuclease